MSILNDLYRWYIDLTPLQHFFFDGVLWLSIFSFVLRDKWSLWLARRKNGITALVPIAAAALLIGVSNLIIAFFKSMHFTWKAVFIHSWVWWATLGGFVIVAIYVGYRRYLKRSIWPWK